MQDGDVSSWGINLVALSLAGGPRHTYTVGLIIMCSFEIRCSNTVCNIFGGGRVLKSLSQDLPPVKLRQLENANAPLGHLCLSIQPFFRVPMSRTRCRGNRAHGWIGTLGLCPLLPVTLDKSVPLGDLASISHTRPDSRTEMTIS